MYSFCQLTLSKKQWLSCWSRLSRGLLGGCLAAEHVPVHIQYKTKTFIDEILSIPPAKWYGWQLKSLCERWWTLSSQYFLMDCSSSLFCFSGGLIPCQENSHQASQVQSGVCWYPQNAMNSVTAPFFTLLLLFHFYTLKYLVYLQSAPKIFQVFQEVKVVSFGFTPDNLCNYLVPFSSSIGFRQNAHYRRVSWAAGDKRWTG